VGAITLIEYAKGSTNDMLRGVVETFAGGSPILGKLAFMDVKSGAIEYNQEETLPGIAFRNLNATYTASSGVLNPLVEKVKILGGTIETDIALIRRFGDSRRALDIAMKVKAAARYFDAQFIDGDEGTYPTQFYGLNKRLTALYADGSGTAGAALSENVVDRVIDAVDEKPDLLVMGKKMYRQLKNLFKGSTIFGFTDPNYFGMRVPTFDGIEIGILDKDNLNNVILDLDETVGSSSGICGSIYALKFGEDRLVGIQTAPPDVKDLGEIAATKLTYRMDWDVGIAMFHPRCAARMSGIIAASGVL